MIVESDYLNTGYSDRNVPDSRSIVILLYKSIAIKFLIESWLFGINSSSSSSANRFKPLVYLSEKVIK